MKRVVDARTLRLLAWLFLVLATATSCNNRGSGSSGSSSAAKRNAPAAESQTAQDRALIPVNGKELLRLVRTTKGKGVLVNVWASWCGSCKREMPLLLKMNEEYSQKGIELMFISVDEPADSDKALDFLEAQGASLPSWIVRGDLDVFKQTMSEKWRGALPASFLFDRTGKLRYLWGAEVYETELRPILDGFLAGRNIDGAAQMLIKRGGGAP